MLYCKNCGRQLKEGARFCDRCGQSVRKTQESTQAAKRREIEELKAERLNRKKRLAEKDAKQAKNKQRRRSGSSAIIFVLVIILIAIASFIFGYNFFVKSNESSDVAETDAPAATATAVPETSPSATGAASSAKYSEIIVGSIKIPYPSDFHANTTTGDEELNITDSLGGANMIVAKEAKSGEITDFIKDYISDIGAKNEPDMHAGSDWYSVTAEVDGKVYHRKSVIRNGLAVYYDFIYDANSTASKKYEEYISYIDSKLK